MRVERRIYVDIIAKSVEVVPTVFDSIRFVVFHRWHLDLMTATDHKQAVSFSLIRFSDSSHWLTYY